ncbi:MAG: response regulator transcription factor [Kiritimatiellae bacterium]|nr:response regulator transcription factor [Kiritimatiellia bacterium]MBQ3340554.1 response regulator transcription factor [Kiritimatiellia bacterium]MBQ6330621.1 response regulator transcription factor [Kiritimatiellia bacterium]
MKKKRALVAEDNDGHYKSFKEFLVGMGLEVEREAFGDLALEKILNSEYDIVILDIELPKKNGREILREVRKSKPYLPIIAVSAFAGVHGEAECLNLGADDYIEKRFNKDTFQARVRRAMWHGSVANQNKVLSWGSINVNVNTRTVRYRRTKMDLSEKEFNILLPLVKAQGRIVDADVLEKAAWGDVNRMSIRLELKIKALRDKFSALGAPRDIIDANRGMGYVLRDC